MSIMLKSVGAANGGFNAYASGQTGVAAATWNGKDSWFFPPQQVKWKNASTLIHTAWRCMIIIDAEPKEYKIISVFSDSEFL